ncbi:cytosol aminopeptidase-like [Teleopsis dalmanni]|uniref:cytosol aminopeptidase-like n=1 Tax=Teleopsis dalmanni TaxID=139649 RepID=UPI000D32985D|nr:cytosol aminopeptidase-like [Teleopsis dalmanni]XP_037960145.1 cytosol aminopeptidase-like [Teleopsis dalmanni]
MAFSSFVALRNAVRCHPPHILNLLKAVNVSSRFFSDDGGRKPNLKGLVLGLYQEEEGNPPRLTSSGEKFDDRVKGKITEVVKVCEMKGKVGMGKVFNNIDTEFRSIAIVGLGREGIGFNELEMIDEGMENARVAAAVGARSLQMEQCSEIYLDSMEYPEQAAEGSSLAVWRYNELKDKMRRTRVPKLEIYDNPDMDAWTRGLFKAEAQNLARRLSDTPANLMTPTIFSQNAVDALCPCGVTVEIRTMDWIEQQQINSFLMIAKGSCEPPLILEVNYCGTAPEDKPVLLVGKGITFNSGGINLRTCKGMDEYRGAMSGAAVVVATLRAAAALSLPINISAVIPLCENMPSGMSCKPGDVVKLLNGKNMSIRDIDKAGVAVMADPILYGQATYKPRLVVDVATLGYGVQKSLGGGATGIFSNSHFIWKQFQKAGALTGDRVWRFPLWQFYKKLVTNHISFDISNNGSGPASSCLAAAILHELLPCVDWAHLDTRGVGMLTKFGTIPYLLKNRMTGRPTRTVVQFLYQMACPDAAKHS